MKKPDLVSYNYKDLKPFSTAYLPGFLADKYDVSQEESMARISERAKNTATPSRIKKKEKAFLTLKVDIIAINIQYIRI